MGAQANVTAAILIQAMDGAAAFCILSCGVSFSCFIKGSGGAIYCGIIITALYLLVFV